MNFQYVKTIDGKSKITSRCTGTP